MSRSYESNGPDVKIRGNAQHIAEKYIALARDASASGDRVMAENYLQHAEHYGRIVAAAQGVFQLQREETDFEGEYEDEGDEGGADGHAGAPNGHPYPVPERAGGGERPQNQPNQMREPRNDYGGGNREHQGNREGQGNRDGREQRFNRDDRNRDYQARDNQNRDNRDYQGRDNRNRDNGNNRNRDFNRDNANRDRNESGERRPWENRSERQPWQERGGERQVPNGLGPQPSVGDLEGSSEPSPTPVARHEERAVHEQPRRDEAAVTANETAAPATAQESGYGEGAPAARDALAAPEGSIVPDEADRAAVGEGRRRGRPRRPRYGEGESAGEAISAATPEPAAGNVPEPLPAAADVTSQPADAASGEAANDAPVKRARGRPRKKKPEDEGGEAPQLPDFLLASNG